MHVCLSLHVADTILAAAAGQYVDSNPVKM
jgi:hypothetical protein